MSRENPEKFIPFFEFCGEMLMIFILLLILGPIGLIGGLLCGCHFYT